MKVYPLKVGTTTNFKIDYQKELNPQQLSAVQAGDGSILVIAGAGSGKTRVITYRVAWLVESGVSPASILLLTFTNKAAREMLRRVEMLLSADTKKIWGGTFHHIGNLILRQHAELLGYKPNYTILDREDSKDLIDDCIGKLGFAKSKYFPKSGVIAEIFGFFANSSKSPSDIIAERFPEFEDMYNNLIRLHKTYEEKKRELNYMDFDDLLTNWKTLFDSRKDILKTYQERFKYILVDEYQDTNKVQADIVEMMAGKTGNIMVVGDDAQAIYSFRGANFANIIDFPNRFPKTQVLKLETNYRSTPEVLDLANSSLEHNQKQFHKVLKAVKPASIKPELVITADVNEQAQFVAQRILEFYNDGISLNDMAILYRSHYHSLEVQMELTRLGVPFEVRSGLRFFEQAHIKDVTAFLRIVANPKDEVAWKRVLKLFPKIGKGTAEKIWQVVLENDEPLANISHIHKKVSKVAQDGFNEFVKLIKKITKPSISASPADMIEVVLDEWYQNYLTLNFPNYYSRIEDIKQLSNFSLKYGDLEKFLEELALLTNVYGEDVIAKETEKELLTLSTVHQAKGLEWRAVFLIWLVDGKFPEGRALKDAGGEEEERRLFYVAITRAKEHIFLVYPTMGYERSMMSIIQRPSRFIQELNGSTYEEVRLAYQKNF